LSLRPAGLATSVPALVVAAVALTAGTAVFLGLHFGGAALLQQERGQLVRLADGYAASVRFYLEGARAMIETTAAAPGVRGALIAAPESREAAIDAARLRARLLLRHSSYFDDVAVIRADGTVALLEPAALERTQIRPDRGYAAWYRDVGRTRRPVISDLQFSPATRQPTVVIASPVHDLDGRYVGVLAGSLRLAELSRVGRSGDMPLVASGFVTDRRGLVVAHQAASRYVEHQTDFSSTPPVRAALAGERGAGRYDDEIERVAQIGAWVPLSEIGWAVVYEEPAEAAAAPLRALTWTFTPLAAGLAVVLGVAGVVLARRVVRPIEELTAAAERSGADVPRFPPRTGRGTEVERLARALGRMGDALRQRAAELERVVGELEAASRAKDQFLATLSHELRTPLNAVYGWARMLRGPALDPAVTARAIAAIERNAAAQAQLINDLLDVSRIVTGKMQLDVRTVNVNDVVRGALETVRLAAEAKGIDLQTALDPHPALVRGDPARLQQVVWNLLVNAVKFTPREGRVRVSVHAPGAHAVIMVRDTGQGITPDVLPHVFERFHQADSGSTRTHGGLGIGLALVRHLVELHGGSVRASSEGQDRGATFVVELPLATGDTVADGDRAPAAVMKTPDETTLAGIDVLVVDDDADSLEMLATLLARQGASVRTCKSAAEGLDALLRRPPDVLLSDVEMPGTDGYGLIRQVRALPAESGGMVPAAAITAYGRPDDRVKALAAGFTMHLPKPVDPDEVAAVVLTLARRD
jgi:signal transduction histidine kinase/CheY-like chemotaxis protein